MFDLIIRGGRIVDGTGAPAFVGDIAVKDGRIAAVGTVEGSAKQEIDAHGLLVTPGWVDMHTHYDGQATWDPYLTPSGWHGVTTVVMGNCGVGFAPCRAEDREWLIEVMEGVEDIPGFALFEGINWDWETFPEYLDALDKLPFAIDVGTQVPHSALRGYVMGQTSSEDDQATPEQIERMYELCLQGLQAGALGFTTSRTPNHKSALGKLVAGTNASTDELFGICRALKDAGHGLFGYAPDHTLVPSDLSWVKKIAADNDCTALFNFSQTWEQPDLWKDILASLEEAEAEGLRVYGQCAGRAIGIMMNWQGTAHPFVPVDAHAALSMMEWPERKEELKKPEVRDAVVNGQAIDLGPFANFIARSFDKMFLFSETLDYEPGPEQSVAEAAKARGISPMELAYDTLTSNDCDGYLYFPLYNYGYGSLDPLYTLHGHRLTRMGLSDGGAHCGAICDAGMPTFMLTHWTRDRSRGPKLPLEHIVHRQTRQTAELFGLMDRGVLKPGYRADINVIDYDGLTLAHPRLVHDLPAGGRRLTQRASGYRYTFVKGQCIMRDDEPTGVMAGQLLRGPQPAPSHEERALAGAAK